MLLILCTHSIVLAAICVPDGPASTCSYPAKLSTHLQVTSSSATGNETRTFWRYHDYDADMLLETTVNGTGYYITGNATKSTCFHVDCDSAGKATGCMKQGDCSGLPSRKLAITARAADPPQDTITVGNHKDILCDVWIGQLPPGGSGAFMTVYVDSKQQDRIWRTFVFTAFSHAFHQTTDFLEWSAATPAISPPCH